MLEGIGRGARSLKKKLSSPRFLSRDEQIDFVYWLADAAEAMRARAYRTAGVVVEGRVVNTRPDDGEQPCGTSS